MQREAPSRDWLVAFYHEALTDIRWAKERTGDIVRWAVILLGALTALSRSIATLDNLILIGFAILVAGGGIWWLVDLYMFARRTRIRLDTILADVSDHSRYPIKRRHDRHHVKYLVIQSLVVLVACFFGIVAIVTRSAGGDGP